MTTLGIRATITSLNVFRQREIVVYFLSFAIMFLLSEPIFTSIYSNENLEYTVPPMTYAENYADAYRYAKAEV